jgi:hypothetical protein
MPSIDRLPGDGSERAGIPRDRERGLTARRSPSLTCLFETAALVALLLAGALQFVTITSNDYRPLMLASTVSALASIALALARWRGASTAARLLAGAIVLLALVALFGAGTRLGWIGR